MKTLEVVCSDTSSGCHSESSTSSSSFSSSSSDPCRKCIPRSASRRIRLKCYEPVRLWTCRKNCTDGGIQLMDPRGPCCSSRCRGRMSSFGRRLHRQMYGIQLTSPEPFYVEYPRSSPIQASVPRKASPRVMSVTKSPIRRRSSSLIHRSVSPGWRVGARYRRRSSSPRCHSPASMHRSVSMDRRSRRRHMAHKPFRSRSYANYGFAEEEEEAEEEVVGRGGGRYIYVNPDYIRRYHGYHGTNESFTSSGSSEQPHYHRHDVLSGSDY